MASRRDRLEKLVTVQEKLKAFHETRHAGFVAAARAAESEAEAVARLGDTPGSMADVFPDLYHRRIADALGRKAVEDSKARDEATLVATATARTNMVERAWRESVRWDEREKSDRERLEIVERSLRERK